MSSAASRVFSACRALLAPATSASRTSSTTASRSRNTAAANKAGKPKKPKAKPPSSSAPSRPTGILKAGPVSPALARFLGSGEASRTDAVKQIWVHIKSHNLQNPSNKREILCDEKLKSLFDGKDKVGFLEIGKLLTPHFAKTS